jgi:hypothetical protein
MNTAQLERTLDNLDKMKAKCGHNDPLGYLSGTVCGKCARRNHRKTMGRR